MDGTMRDLPIPFFGLICAATALLSIEVGWRLGMSRKRHAEREKKAPLDAAVGATLGLLAFLLAFTFGMAAARYDNRRTVVLDEAMAIGTTYLRADFLSDAGRDESRRLLHEYLVLRSKGESSVLKPEERDKTAALHDRLWRNAVNEQRLNDRLSTTLYTDSLNKMIDLDSARVAALRNTIPDNIWIMLGIVTVLSLNALGYLFGLNGGRSWMETVLLALVFAVVITLIGDLDSPQKGLIQVSQQPLLDLLNQLDAGLAATKIP